MLVLLLLREVGLLVVGRRMRHRTRARGRRGEGEGEVRRVGKGWVVVEGEQGKGERKQKGKETVLEIERKRGSIVTLSSLGSPSSTRPGGETRRKTASYVRENFQKGEGFLPLCRKKRREEPEGRAREAVPSP